MALLNLRSSPTPLLSGGIPGPSSVCALDLVLGSRRVQLKSLIGLVCIQSSIVLCHNVKNDSLRAAHNVTPVRDVGLLRYVPVSKEWGVQPRVGCAQCSDLDLYAQACVESSVQSELWGMLCLVGLDHDDSAPLGKDSLAVPLGKDHAEDHVYYK